MGWVVLTADCVGGLVHLVVGMGGFDGDWVEGWNEEEAVVLVEIADFGSDLLGGKIFVAANDVANVVDCLRSCSVEGPAVGSLTASTFPRDDP